jgi:hypothetical protein
MGQHRTELKQKPLVSIFYGEDLDRSIHFQPFDQNKTVNYEDRAFNFVDVDIRDTDRRQCQHSSVQQQIRIRTNPEASQDGIEIPGLETPTPELEIIEILQMIELYDGVRDAIVEIIHLYYDNDDKLVRRRIGLHQIVSTVIQDGMVTFYLTSDVTPISPMIPEIRRVS